METLIARSFYSPAKSVPVIVIRKDGAQVLGLGKFLREPYEVLYEAYTPNSNTVRRRITPDVEIQVERELQVDIDRRQLEGLSVWKPFQHYKRWWDFDSTTAEQTLRIEGDLGEFPLDEGACLAILERGDDLRIAGVFGKTGDPTFGLPVWFDKDNDSGEWITPPEDLEALIDRSIKRLIPKVRNRVQLLNTLYELKDVKTLGHTISRIKTLGYALRNRGLVGSLRDIAVSGSDVFLQMQFNIKPLIKDIQGIYQSLVDSLGPLRRQMEFDGVPQTSYFRCLFDEDEQDFSDELEGDLEMEFSPNPALIGGEWVTLPSSSYIAPPVTRQVKTLRSHFYAQLRFIARWSDNQHKYAKQLALVDALGLSFNPKHVWDALPWTFVIDWVFQVGDFLDQFAKGALDPVLDILDYSWAVKREREITLSSLVYDDVVDSGSPFQQPNVVNYPIFRETAYRRQPMALDTRTSALVRSGVSSHELTLAAALVITRKRKLRKPKTRTGRRAQRKDRTLLGLHKLKRSPRVRY
jgi:hypothetical protein